MRSRIQWLSAALTLLLLPGCGEPTRPGYRPDVPYVSWESINTAVDAAASWEVRGDTIRLRATFVNVSGQSTAVEFGGGSDPARLLLYDGSVASGRLIYSALEEFPGMTDVLVSRPLAPGQRVEIAQSFISRRAREAAGRVPAPIGVVLMALPRGGFAGVLAGPPTR